MPTYRGSWWRACSVCLPRADGTPRVHYEGTRKPKHITRPALRVIPGGLAENRA
jgi:hypothetical protein